MTSHEDLSVVLIESSLVVSNSWHVLDNYGVVGMLAFLVKNSVCSDHVIDDVGLGNLLGAELLVRAKILAIVVAKVIIASNGCELDTSAD